MPLPGGRCAANRCSGLLAECARAVLRAVTRAASADSSPRSWSSPPQSSDAPLGRTSATSAPAQPPLPAPTPSQAGPPATNGQAQCPAPRPAPFTSRGDRPALVPGSAPAPSQPRCNGSVIRRRDSPSPPGAPHDCSHTPISPTVHALHAGLSRPAPTRGRGCAMAVANSAAGLRKSAGCRPVRCARVSRKQLRVQATTVPASSSSGEPVTKDDLVQYLAAGCRPREQWRWVRWRARLRARGALVSGVRNSRPAPGNLGSAPAARSDRDRAAAGERPRRTLAMIRTRRRAAAGCRDAVTARGRRRMVPCDGPLY
jgi:hypothetical protein